MNMGCLGIWFVRELMMDDRHGLVLMMGVEGVVFFGCDV